MSFDAAIKFCDVWKKYSRREIFHRSLREDAMGMLGASGAMQDDLKVDEFWALSNLNFELSAGDCVSFEGHNGSGKTTILKLISRVTRPTRGGVDVCGRVAPLLEVGPGFHPDLTGRENIYMNGTILGMTISEVRNLERKIVDYAEIGEFVGTPVKKYSSGMLMRLGFSIAIHSSSDIFLFDEIFSVADSDFRKKCKESIVDLSRNGKIVILVNHDRENYGFQPTRSLVFEHGYLIAS